MEEREGLGARETNWHVMFPLSEITHKAGHEHKHTLTLAQTIPPWQGSHSLRHSLQINEQCPWHFLSLKIHNLTTPEFL